MWYCFSLKNIISLSLSYERVFTIQMFYTIVIQLQAREEHVARHSIVSSLRNHSEKIFKLEISRETCEVTFVSLNCLRC